MSSKFTKIHKFIKSRVTDSSKYIVVTLLPVGIIGSAGFYFYRYGSLFSRLELMLNADEERMIAKRLFPIFKYRLIDMLYDSNSRESIILAKVYDFVNKHMKAKLKAEVYLYESDKFNLAVLPNGPLFMSDQLYYSIKEQGGVLLLIYVLSHAISHISNHDTSKNLVKLYSKVIL